MKILMLLQKDFPPDIRVEKEARALQSAGYEVHLLCKNNAGKADAIIDGVHVHRIRTVLQRPLRNKLANFPLFCNPAWVGLARKIIQREKIDVVHAHDLPMVPLGLLVAGKQRPVIYDMHENYPAALQTWARRDLLSVTIKNPRLAAGLDRFVCKKVDQIIVVVEEQRQRLIHEGVSADKITVVGNRVETDAFRRLPIDEGLTSRYRDLFVLLYAGSFARDRGLEVAILAIRGLRTKIANLRLVLVGDGPNRDELAQLAREQGVLDLVEFAGWQPFHSMPSYMQAAAICLVPQPSNAFIDTTIPHKLFQYMTLRRPVLVSDAKPLARFVSALRAGEIFRSRDIHDFEKSVLKIFENSLSYYPQNDAELEDAIDWQQDAEALVSLYEKLSTRLAK